MTPGIIAFLILIAVYLYLIWPKKATAAQKAPLLRRSYAHRGLHNIKELGIAENSLAAFDAAMQHGYGCELDVQFTADKKLIVFHDDDYARVCGLDRGVHELTLEEAKHLKLLRTTERVPTFDEVLALVDGRNPLIVELKASPQGKQWNYELCEAVAKRLDSYEGDYCIESFHPMIVRWFMKNRPGTVRGLLVEGPPKEGVKNEALLSLISELMLNFLCRPHFIAYHHSKRNLALRIAQKLGAFTVMWTVRDEETHKELQKKEDCIIFENYLPATHYESDSAK
ncbi:MAG: glycerophosphodiester phosphodiesterase [Oscillospiraceae bacterium]|nr:glycerophosphodiester phosphodiesterase [Oscillospiraceae bacterium]